MDRLTDFLEGLYAVKITIDIPALDRIASILEKEAQNKIDALTAALEEQTAKLKDARAALESQEKQTNA